MRRVVFSLVLCVIILNAYAQDSNRPAQPNLPGDIMLDFGINIWDSDTDELPRSWWGSNAFSVSYLRRVKLTDRLSLYPGLSFTSDKYAFSGNHSWFRQDDGTYELDTLAGVQLTKNKLVTNYLEIPVEFRIFPLGTVNGEGWFIGLGAMAGMRLGAHTKVKYDLSAEDTKKEKFYDDLRTQTFRYGLQARFGFKSFHLYYKYYLNDVFSREIGTDEIRPQASTVGISFSFF